MDFPTLNRSRFVSLSTFRKTGVAVSTPVWIAADGDDLLVTTPSGSGKLKRLRNNPRVEMQPCSRMGKLADGAPVVVGEATIEPETAALEAIFKKKYGAEYWLFLKIEKLFSKGNQEREIIRIRRA
jgi:PPOX class probable F420-dependent enzyme